MSGGAPLADPDAMAAEWDLSALVNGRGDDGVEPLLAEAARDAAEFAREYQGAVAELDAAGLTEAMRRLAAIRELIDRASGYAYLRFATDSSDPARGALLDQVRARTTALQTELLFFELEWTAIDTQRAEALLTAAGAELEFAAHHLRMLQRRRPHVLSPAEERVLTERRLTGELAWARLFEELAGSLEVELDGERVPYAVAYNQLTDPDAGKRRSALEAMSSGVESGLSTRGFVLNTLLQDKAVEDRLRGYPSWLSSRNLDNQLDDAAVQALIDAVTGRYELARRWARVKARLLGTERLEEADLLAPVLADERTYPYTQARDLVLAAYEDLSPEVGAIARRFFDEHWIDAPIRPNKMAGAFCETAGSQTHPFLLLNHSGRRYDVSVMAHELGHGIHSVLSAPTGVFHHMPPMPVAETASTFGELLLLERMLSEAGSDRERASLLAAAVDQSLATIFIQVAFNRFEDRVHTARREDGELAVERLNRTFREIWDELYGDTLAPHPGSERHWSMVPHFFLWPGYVYAYAYGNLLSLAIFARYREVGPAFVPSLIEFLSAGGSRPPEELGHIVGVDLRDEGFWNAGLDLVAEQIQAVEELTADLGADARP